MLTVGRLGGALVLLKAVDVVARGPDQLPLLLWLAAVSVWVAGAGLLLAGRYERPGWALVLAAGLALAADFPADLRRQHLVLLLLIALVAALTEEARERLLLWRVQLSALYGTAGLAKVNESFLSGTVLASAVPRLPLALLVVASVAVVAVELLLAATPWIPRLRRAGVVIASALHLGALALLSVTPEVGLRLVVFGGAAVLLCAVSAGLVTPAQAGPHAVPARHRAVRG